jgi:RNA polymerase sigma-70 factor (ECF subfamily)
MFMETMSTTTEQLVDELLVLRCQDGEAEAFDELVQRWQQRLWRHACRLTGQEDAAWDVVQDGWAAIIRGIRRLDDPARFRQWAYCIITHKAADWIRSRQSARQRIEPLPDDPPGISAGGEQESQEEAASMLRRLPRDQQTILALHYVEGFDVREIAGILGVPEGTVKSRLHHAREELRRRIQEKRS